MYEANIVVGPTQAATRSQGLQLGGGNAGAALSALTGGFGRGGSADDFTIFRALLTSEAVIDDISAQPNFHSRVLGPAWDPATKSIRPSTGVLSKLKHRLFSMLGVDFPIDDRRATAGYISNIVDIRQLATTGLYQISVRHRDPDVAKDLLVWLYHADDERLRNTKIKQYIDYAAYLRKRLDGTSSEAVRKSLIETEQDQEVQAVLAQAGLPFAAELSSGPTLSGAPVSPAPMRWLLIAWGLGLALGVLVSLRIRGRRQRVAIAPAYADEQIGA
ncbi:MAG TPA: hypothetical protein VGV37_08700 [Aliidongia sp.]|uniref:hypothetical protein n=1 Tax=Aliidongia sp. TaxID=1914230 RepID=UPI002DDCB5FD|nr:hypothetical protein [Aliidongia sp.]HEV2674607.1 hypothetical protein [Aliidongia sp.]